VVHAASPARLVEVSHEQASLNRKDVVHRATDPLNDLVAHCTGVSHNRNGTLLGSGYLDLVHAPLENTSELSPSHQHPSIPSSGKARALGHTPKPLHQAIESSLTEVHRLEGPLGTTQLELQHCAATAKSYEIKPAETRDLRGTPATLHACRVAT